MKRMNERLMHYTESKGRVYKDQSVSEEDLNLWADVQVDKRFLRQIRVRIHSERFPVENRSMVLFSLMINDVT